MFREGAGRWRERALAARGAAGPSAAQLLNSWVWDREDSKPAAQRRATNHQGKFRMCGLARFETLQSAEEMLASVNNKILVSPNKRFEGRRISFKNFKAKFASDGTPIEENRVGNHNRWRLPILEER